MRAQSTVVVVLGAGLLSLACVHKQGWQRVSRGCEGDSVARVCVVAQPDQPARVEVGGIPLVPGECALAPGPGRGSITLRVVDGRTAVAQTQRVRVGPGKTTYVRLGPEGDLKIARVRCGADD